MSQVSIRRWHVAEEAAPADAGLQEALEAFKRDKPYLKKWLVIVPMVSSGPTTWQGNALDQNGRCVTLHYDSASGLAVHRPDN